MTLYERVVAGYRCLNRWAGPLTLALFLLLMRADFGYQLYVTGKGHLTHWHTWTRMVDDNGVMKEEKVNGTIENFTQWNVPHPVFSAYVASTVELIGGLLLMVGICSRPLAVVLTIQMMVAFISPPWDRDRVIAFFNPDGNSIDIINGTPFLFLVTTILVFALGPGWFSIDAILKRFVFDRRHDESKLKFG